MSVRLAKKPLTIPKGVDVSLQGRELTVKGSKGTMTHTLHDEVGFEQTEEGLVFKPVDATSSSKAQTGTAYALVKNMTVGVSEGFEKKLTLIGVGYRAQVQGKTLVLTLGFSHPVNYAIPEGITIEAPSQTDLVVKGIDRQVVGQVSAEIRRYRPPEPYKGKGIRYADEVIVRKETKKK